MPYDSDSDVPPAVRDRHSGRCLTVWREVFNETFDGDEGRAFATAETAAKKCEASKMTETSTMAVKFVDGTDGMIEGLGIPFGGPVGGSDVHGERFHKGTDIAEEWFPQEGRPFLFHHGLDAEAKATLMGRQVEREVTDKGHWVKVQLDKRSKYMEALQELVDNQALGFSSGAYPHLVRTRKDGTIDYWPVVEFSGTPTPANVLGDIYTVKSEDAVERLVAVKAADALMAILHAKEGSGSEVEPFADHASRIAADVDAFADRAEWRGEMRAKAGRALSAANRAEIADIVERLKPLGEGYTRLVELLERSDPVTAEAAKVAEAEYLRFLREQARVNGVPLGT